MSEMPQVEGIADDLRAEAKQLLYELFHSHQPLQDERDKLDRFVDCVIGSALLHTLDSLAQAQAAQEKKILEAIGEQNASD